MRIAGFPHNNLLFRRYFRRDFRCFVWRRFRENGKELIFFLV